MEALHEAGVIHRDLKAENVLVDSYGHIRLADMNAAKRDNNSLPAGGRTRCWHLCCGARGASGQDGLFIAADWWSYGVLLFECLAGRPPTRKTRSWCTPRRGWSMRSSRRTSAASRRSVRGGGGTRR